MFYALPMNFQYFQIMVYFFKLDYWSCMVRFLQQMETRFPEITEAILQNVPETEPGGGYMLPIKGKHKCTRNVRVEGRTYQFVLHERKNYLTPTSL